MKNPSLIISANFTNQDGTIRESIKKYSDKLTVVNCFLPGKKNPDGTYGDSASVEVRVTSTTKIAPDVVLEPKAHIDVDGFLSANSYTGKDGKKRTYLIIVATEITKTVFANAAPTAVPASTQNPAAPVTSANSAAPVGTDDLASLFVAESTPAPAPAPETVNSAANNEDDFLSKLFQ